MRGLAHFGSDIRDLGKIGGKRVHVIEREARENPGFLTARLHRSPARNDNHQLGTEIRENVGAGLAEAVAVGEQHDDRSDAPRHAQHGERRAAPVIAHGGIGFPKQILKHKKSIGNCVIG